MFLLEPLALVECHEELAAVGVGAAVVGHGDEATMGKPQPGMKLVGKWRACDGGAW